MGFLTQLKRTLVPSREDRIEREVNEKVDQIQDLAFKGGSDEDWEKAINSLLTPSEFNEMNGAMMRAAEAYVSSLAAQETDMNNPEMTKFKEQAKDSYLLQLKNSIEFFDHKCMFQFTVARAIKDNFSSFEWPVIHTFAQIDEEYFDQGWMVVAWFFALCDEAESRYGEGGCSKNIFQSLKKELSDSKTINKYLATLNQKQIDWFKCID